MSTLFRIFIVIALCPFGIVPVNVKGEALNNAQSTAPRLVVFEGFYNPA